MEIVTEPTVSETIESTQNIDTWNTRELSSEHLQSFISSRLSAAALQDVLL